MSPTDSSAGERLPTETSGTPGPGNKRTQEGDRMRKTRTRRYGWTCWPPVKKNAVRRQRKRKHFRSSRNGCFDYLIQSTQEAFDAPPTSPYTRPRPPSRSHRQSPLTFWIFASRPRRAERENSLISGAKMYSCGKKERSWDRRYKVGPRFFTYVQLQISGTGSGE